MLSFSETRQFTLEIGIKSHCFSFFYAAHLTALTSSQGPHCSCCNLTFMRCHFSWYYHLDWCWLHSLACCHSFHATFSSKDILNAFSMCLGRPGSSALLCPLPRPFGSVLAMVELEETLGCCKDTPKGLHLPAAIGAPEDTQNVATKQLQCEKTNYCSCKIYPRSLTWIHGCYTHD